jgi:hypothetical protein
MKTKHLILKAIFAAVFLAATPAASAQVSSDSDKTEIILTSRTTPDQLESMIKQLDEKGMELKVTKAEHSKSGRLRSISGEVDFKDGHSGNFESTRVKKIVITRNYTGDKKPLEINLRAS